MVVVVYSRWGLSLQETGAGQSWAYFDAFTASQS